MSAARRVCFLIPDFSDGGAQKQCIYLLNALQQDPSLELTLIHFREGVHYDLLQRDRLRVIRIPVRSNYDPRTILKLRRLLGELRPDVLLTWLQSCDVIGFCVRRAAPGMRWIMTERDSEYPPDIRFMLRQRLGRFADAIIANSDKGREYWRDSQARGKLFVVPNIVHQSAGSGQDGPRAARAMTIGRLEAQKNAGTVIEAFCRLAADKPDLSFSVVGAGSQRQTLEGHVAKAGQAHRIHFLGFCSDVCAQIAKAGVVVSMSHHEGMPNVLLESVAGDRLVVASDIPEHRAVLGDDYPYYVADRENPQTVAETVAAALSARDDVTPLRHARAQIAIMTESAVSDAYKRIFVETLKAIR